MLFTNRLLCILLCRIVSYENIKIMVRYWYMYSTPRDLITLLLKYFSNYVLYKNKLKVNMSFKSLNYSFFVYKIIKNITKNYFKNYFNLITLKIKFIYYKTKIYLFILILGAILCKSVVMRCVLQFLQLLKNRSE